MCKLAAHVWQFFSRKHYRCSMCGAYSSSPEALCYPVEKEFEE